MLKKEFSTGNSKTDSGRIAGARENYDLAKSMLSLHAHFKDRELDRLWMREIDLQGQYLDLIIEYEEQKKRTFDTEESHTEWLLDHTCRMREVIQEMDQSRVRCLGRMRELCETSDAPQQDPKASLKP